MAKTLVKNIGFLTLSQAANFLFPLVTIPYVTRVVGPDNYGLLEFTTVAMLYFSAIVIYGFNVTATRRIAAKPHDIDNVNSVFSRVVTTRLILFLVASAIFIICLLALPTFGEYKKMLLFAFPIVLGWALYPDFLFQGLQKLQFVALANFLIKALAAALIFVVIKSPEDFYLVLAINAAAQIVVGAGLLMASVKLVSGLKLLHVSFKEIASELKEGSYAFLSLFFNRIYVFGSILFLGLMLSEFEMGLFAASFKLIIVAQSFLFLPLTGALFPYLSNLYSTSFKSYKRHYRKFQLLMLLITSLSAGVLMLFPEFFIKLVFGADYLAAAPYLQIMAPALVATTVSHFAMQLGLYILKKDNIYLVIVIGIGLISVVLNLIFIKAFGLYGAAWVKLAVDVMLALTGYWFFTKELRKVIT